MFDTLFERLARRVENMLFRAVVRRVRFTEGQGAIIAQVSGRSGETPDDVLIMQPYGFDHFPLPVEGGGRGAEMIALQLERNLVVGFPRWIGGTAPRAVFLTRVRLVSMTIRVSVSR